MTIQRRARCLGHRAFREIFSIFNQEIPIYLGLQTFAQRPKPSAEYLRLFIKK